ncbi:MAG: FAD-binding oxidoreductase, partial [Anaerolineales bacterium]|nr:FAD-binding oxidoreductase [Anaerolineales bacterium]
MTADAIVIGGGIVGASLAYHLVKGGINTLLIDRHDSGRATDAGAGILSPETSSTTSDDWYRLGINAFAYYHPLIEALNKEQALTTGFERCGLLRLAVSDDELAPYEESRQLVFGRQRAYQYPSVSDLYEVTAAQAAALFPALAPVQKAFYHHSAARVDGRLLTDALTAAALNQGLTVHHKNVEQLLIKAGRVTGVVADGETFTADQVAIAGGAWSAAFEEQAGLKIPVAPQRGQIIHLQLDVETAAWPVLHPFHGHY